MDNELTLDMSLFPKELKLLLALIGPVPPEDQALADRMEAGDLTNINWDRFFELALHHRVYPSVYTNLKRWNSKLLPEEVMKALYAAYGRNTFQMMHITAALDKICRLFDENRIRSLMLKGPILAEELYGELSLRTCKDLDILVPADDVELAESVLLAAGYELDEDEVRILNDWKWRVHHISYTNPQTGVQIELHWRLNPDRGKEPSFEELWERRRTSGLTQHPLYYLGAEDMFLFLVQHGARHGWFRLRWLLDIDRMLAKPLDGRSVAAHLKRYHSLAIGGQALILASQLLRTPINSGMKPIAAGSHAYRLAEGAIIFLNEIITLSPVPQHLTIYYRRYLFSLRSASQKLLFIVSLLYPNNRDIETLRLPKKLYVLYFPLRPFLWIWRRRKQQASS